MGFLENSERLQIDPLELLTTYHNIRKFKLYATANNLRIVLINYSKLYQSKQQKPISKHYYEFLLTFVFDHAVQRELHNGLERLFQQLMIDLYEEFDQYRKLRQLIPTSAAYLSMLRLPAEFYFHTVLENHLVPAWS